MQIRSLGFRTDLIFIHFDGEIVDRGDYLVVRSPLNPSFYWGNFLLFAGPPTPGDEQRWCQLFAREIGVSPQITHMVFGWDSPAGELGSVGPFLRAGFRLVRNEVMVSREVKPPSRRATFVEVRPLRTEAEWAQAVEVQVECREAEHEEAPYREFRRRQMARYRSMASAGLGDWFGAFTDGRLVADLGLFTDGEIGRYQSVETHPDFRRQGIGGSLVFEAGRQSMSKYRLNALVIVAEAESKASRLYGSVGFQRAEAQVGLERW